MSISHEAKAIESRATDLGVPMKDVLSRAKIHRTTWQRWRDGDFEPQMGKWRKVTKALAEIEREKTA